MPRVLIKSVLDHRPGQAQVIREAIRQRDTVGRIAQMFDQAGHAELARQPVVPRLDQIPAVPLPAIRIEAVGAVNQDPRRHRLREHRDIAGFQRLVQQHSGIELGLNWADGNAVGVADAGAALVKRPRLARRRRRGYLERAVEQRVALDRAGMRSSVAP